MTIASCRFFPPWISVIPMFLMFLLLNFFRSYIVCLFIERIFSIFCSFILRLSSIFCCCLGVFCRSSLSSVILNLAAVTVVRHSKEFFAYQFFQLYHFCFYLSISACITSWVLLEVCSIVSLSSLNSLNIPTLIYILCSLCS